MTIAERPSPKERIRKNTQRVHEVLLDLRERVDEVLAPGSLQPVIPDGQASNIIFMGRFEDTNQETIRLQKEARARQQEAARKKREKKKRIKDAIKKLRQGS